MSQSAYTAQLLRPPSRQDVVASCPQLGIPACRPLLPFYSKEADRQADRHKDLKQAVAAELAAFAGARDSLDEQQAAAMGRTFGLVPQLGRSLTPDSQADPRRRVSLQTVRRPPSRQQIADWFRMRAAMKVHDGGATRAGFPSAVNGEESMDCSQDNNEHQCGTSGKRKVFVVKHDDDSDGSEMSCSSLSSCEENSPLSSAARTRPLDDCSPVLTKMRTTGQLQPPPRSIMKHRESSEWDGSSSSSQAGSPALTQTPGPRGRRAAQTEEAKADKIELLGRLKRRRISWHLPGQSSGEPVQELQHQEIDNLKKNSESVLSESLLRRVQEIIRCKFHFESMIFI